jgi:hypothetical protein
MVTDTIFKEIYMKNISKRFGFITMIAIMGLTLATPVHSAGKVEEARQAIGMIGEMTANARQGDGTGGSNRASGGSSSSSGSARGGSLSGTWVTDVSTDTMGYFGIVEITFNNGNFESLLDGSPLHRGTFTTSGNTYRSTTTQVHGGQFSGLLESKWYTKAEFKASLMGQVMSDANLNQLFGTQSGAYSISGNKLTMPNAGGGSMTLTRKR